MTSPFFSRRAGKILYACRGQMGFISSSEGSMTFRVQSITTAAMGLAMFLAILSTPSPATAAIEPRSILKTFFETGDIPTQDQFTTLIDSTLNVISDRYLLGLRQYDPSLTYHPGDTALAIKRFGIGDSTPAAPLGYADPTTTPMAFVPTSPASSASPRWNLATPPAKPIMASRNSI